LRDAGTRAAADAVAPEIDALLAHLPAIDRLPRATAVRRAIMQLDGSR
jgi:hypothetical protein